VLLKRKVLLVNLSMLGIAIAWGYTFVLSKELLEEMTPFYFIGTRFLLAALLIVPFKWKEIRNTHIFTWKMGAACGLMLGAAFTLQILGIEMTTPGKAGVITGTLVVLVPFLYFVWTRIPVRMGPVLGSISAFIGLLLLSSDGDWSGINWGDFLVFLCAICFAIHIVMVDRIYSKGVSFDAFVFVMIQLLVAGIVDTGIALVIEPVPQPISPYGWYAYGFDLLIGTLLAYIVQIKAQQYSSPTHISLLISFEPVFAFVFSCLLWGEIISAASVIGVVLILLGIFSTEAFDIVRHILSRKSTVSSTER
jgi:drug/metabolite transporter (DMT)-like permease